MMGRTVVLGLAAAAVAAVVLLAVIAPRGWPSAKEGCSADSALAPTGSPSTLEEVYRRAGVSLRQQGCVYHETVEVDADMGFITYSGTTERWTDAYQGLAREEADLGQRGKMTSVLTAEAKYVRNPSGRVVATPGKTWRCYGAGVAASAVLGCPGPTERSTTEVQQGEYAGRPAIVLVTTGTSSGSDETFTFTKRLYLDPDTYLPRAMESEGQVDFGQVKPTHERRVYRHELIRAESLPADLFDPASIGYAPPDPQGPLNQPMPDMKVYWLGREFPGAAGLPPLVLAKTDQPSGGPGYRFLLHYARADDPFGPPVVTLQLWPRGAWGGSIERSKGMNMWEDPCWEQREIALAEGQAKLFAGFTSDVVRLPANEQRDCPTRPHDSFIAHAYLGQTVVFATAPGSSGAQGMAKSPYDTGEGLEAVVRALRPR